MDAEPAENAPKTSHTALAAGLTVLAGLLRLVPHAWYLAPMGAIGVFAGARMRGWWALGVPLLVRAGTDLALAQTYEGFPIFDPYVYGSYVVCVLLGRMLRRTNSPARIVGASLVSSIIFFIVTNFGTWALFPETYPDRSWTGILQAYEAGIVFYRGAFGFISGVFLGDLMYTSILFGAHALIARWLERREAARLAADVQTND
jgi:hypothetical protein